MRWEGKRKLKVVLYELFDKLNKEREEAMVTTEDGKNRKS